MGMGPLLDEDEDEVDGEEVIVDKEEDGEIDLCCNM